MNTDAKYVSETAFRGDAMLLQQEPKNINVQDDTFRKKQGLNEEANQENTSPQITQKMKLLAVVAAVVIICSLAISIAALVMAATAFRQVNIKMHQDEIIPNNTASISEAIEQQEDLEIVLDSSTKTFMNSTTTTPTTRSITTITTGQTTPPNIPNTETTIFTTSKTTTLPTTTSPTSIKTIQSTRIVHQGPVSCATSSVNGRQVLRSGEEIYCEDGWTVFQRRLDGSVDFQVNWYNYTHGFGNLSGEFWFGLDKIHNLTSQGNCRLRVDILAFDNDTAYAEYSSFSVDDKSTNYRLHVTGYSGTAGDSLNHHNNRPFSTFDMDHDSFTGGNCATHWGDGQGGWWFTSCFRVSLNAVWGRSERDSEHIIWVGWKGVKRLKATTMKLQCD